MSKHQRREDKWPGHDYRDPVCGMRVSLDTAPADAEFGGRTFYFCAEICRDRFLQDPEKYVAQQESGHVTCDHQHPRRHLSAATCGRHDARHHRF